jgi:hypothetical protein
VDVLRWELESFVCSGEYERGLETILGTFLTNLPQTAAARGDQGSGGAVDEEVVPLQRGPDQARHDDAAH